MEMLQPLCNSALLIESRVLVLFIAATAITVTSAVCLRRRKFHYPGVDQNPQLLHVSRSPIESKMTQRKKLSQESSDTEINALRDFDWSTTEPLVLRTFKPQYHLTMGTSLYMPRFYLNSFIVCSSLEIICYILFGSLLIKLRN